MTSTYNGQNIDYDENQQIVQTSYGRGLILKRRKSDEIKEIRLLEWDSASNNNINGLTLTKKVPMLYTMTEYPTVTVMIGDEVITPFGRGVVLEKVVVRIRKKDDNDSKNSSPTETVSLKYHVLLSSWRLTGRSRVKCYLFSSHVKVVRAKTLREMDPYERVEYAMKRKETASALFQKKNYNDALIKYAEAVDAVRYLQHTPNSSNECRADLVLVIVTCSNNAATCCMKLNKFDEASRFAKNALILLSALYNKRGMKIHGIMIKDHHLTDAKCFGEWRGKSCLIMAQCEKEKQYFDNSISHVNEAKDYISEYLENETDSGFKRLKDLMKEITKVKSAVVAKKKKILEDEKAKAKKMFASKQTKQSKEPPNDSIPTDAAIKKNTVKAKQDDFVAQEGTNKQEDTNKSDSDSPKKSSISKRVSFAENLEERHILESDYAEDEEEPWYQEHKEALILLTIGGLALFTAFLSGKSRKR